ncbi:MAG TPA: DUF5916 domain-containing protein [Chitinophagaceae bacterium]|nr:DUF5916 domain-containing protein [Chitinophagaceae bacterium]
MRKLIFFFTCIAYCYVAAQETPTNAVQKEFQIHISKTNAPVKIDGELKDLIWGTAQKTTPFWRKFPTDGGRPKRNTEVQVAYDDKFIYVAFTAFDSGKAFISGLKRDIGYDGNDGVAIVLDPINQKANGFFFVINAFNAQSEDQLSDGIAPTWSWDNKWFSATKRYPDRWTAEIAIPLKTIRYTPDKKIWGINFTRIDTKTNEISCWTKVPVNYNSYDFGFTGALVWKENPPQPGTNIVVVPYVTGQLQSDAQNNLPTKASANAGFDSKVALTSSLNLDLTVNPDFSQVEVDRQVTNLTRFNIFFPEKRTFFLENSDLYSLFGYSRLRPFYSRSIGLDKSGNRIPILFGARLTGNVSKNTRIGALNIQTGRKGNYNPENYTAITVSQRLFKRSIIKGLFLNHDASLTDVQKLTNPLDEYGRNIGGEFSYSSENAAWNGGAAYHQSFKPGIKSNDKYLEVFGLYNKKNWYFSLDMVSVGTNYYADLGYIQRVENYDAEKDTVIRLGYKSISTYALYRVFSQKRKITYHGIGFGNTQILNPDNTFNERSSSLNYYILGKNTSSFNIVLQNDRINLLFPTRFTSKAPLPKGTYTYTSVFVRYASDFRKTFGYTFGGTIGGFYNGTTRQLTAGINFRRIPNINIGIDASYYKLLFPEPYGNRELFLISPRVEINFSTNIFWTTFLQYNTQGNNFNINSRFQWRYKPLSDLFLVYTDNYYTDPLFKNKNRAVVLKMNYWLNL